MTQKRGYRWALFLVAVCCFLYVTAVSATAWAIAAFFLSGGLWFWLERNKTRELDAPRPK